MTFTFATSTFSSSAAPVAIETSPLVCRLPTLPRPLCKPSYEEGWKKTILTLNHQNLTVFGLAWQDRYLVAVTSSGSVCIWDIPGTDTSEAESETDTELQDVPCQTPLLQVQVTGGCLSTVHFLETNQKVFMLLCGDGGVWGYDWKHWLQLIDGTGNRTGTTALEPKLEMHYRPHPCPHRGEVKINDFTVAHGEKYILGAAADAFGGYKWDMETQKLLCNYPSARKGELSTITCIDSDKSSTVLMGGQDGIIGIWDCHADALIDNIDLKKTMDKHPSLVVERGQAPPWDVKTNLSISHIVSSCENWWTVCGGTLHTHGGGGHVTSWHAPTRTLVAGGTTRETVQFASSCSSSTTTTNLLTLANEGVVTHWSQPQLERKHRAWCSPPSSFAAAHRNDDHKLAVGGVGNLVDIFDNMTDKLYSLSLMDTV